MRTRSNERVLDGFRWGSKESGPLGRFDRFGRSSVALAIALFIATGCSASVRMRPTVAGYAVYPVDNVPAALDAYPHFLYEDRYAYLIDGQWYYPTTDGWVIFLEEPRTLAQYRSRVQSAPPAVRQPDVYYGYPPPQRPPPPTPPQELRREYRPQ